MTADDEKYAVCVPRMTNNQWNWLCNNIGKPQKDWAYNFAHIWFFSEKDRTAFLLRWA
jgi:hypothetical protein